jgi:hypothetical protein
MSDYHNMHWVEFFPKSRFSAPVFTAVNCIMFDVLSRLTGPDADLFFATSHCFVCHHALYHSESCPQCSLGTLFCKRLDDPHRELFSCVWLCLLADDRMQGGTLTALVWLRLGSERPSGRVRKDSGKRLLHQVMLVGIFQRTIFASRGGLLQMLSW